MKIHLFRDLLEEKRYTMELYADRLARALETYCPERCQVRQYRPHEVRVPAFLRRLPKMSKLINYYSRFIAYPRQVRHFQGDINHVIDHGYGHLVGPLDPKRTVVTCHDLILLKVMKGDLEAPFRPRIAMRAFQYSTSRISRAARVLADSESTKKDLVRYGLCEESKISVVYQGIDEGFAQIRDENFLRQIAKKYRLRNSWKVLHVGGCDFYKNIEGILKTFAILLSEFGLDCCLIKVGAEFTPEQRKLIAGLGIGKRIIHLGRVPGEDLPAIYNLADVLLFPSLYEGFGWPVLEAMACGTPVVASNAGSLPELVGDAGLTLAPTDYGGLAEAVRALLTKRELRESLVEKGLKRVRLFRWDKAAEQVADVYEKVFECSQEILQCVASVAK